MEISLYYVGLSDKLKINRKKYEKGKDYAAQLITSLKNIPSLRLKCGSKFLSLFYITQPAKLQKNQCGGVYFCVYGTAFSMPIQQKVPSPVLLFSDFVD